MGDSGAVRAAPRSPASCSPSVVPGAIGFGALAARVRRRHDAGAGLDVDEEVDLARLDLVLSEVRGLDLPAEQLPGGVVPSRRPSATWRPSTPQAIRVDRCSPRMRGGARSRMSGRAESASRVATIRC
ncbi:MAG: hypothetical protein MZV64_13805 [Ignavibacteriales bacterium]|nr:hypothetical protein [Ignavibacteriales bacterium]